MKTVAFVVPNFGRGSGGHRTIFQNFNYLAENGYQCEMYVTGSDETDDDLRARVLKDYGMKIKGAMAGVGEAGAVNGEYDVAIATYHGTAEMVAKMRAGRKMYLMQDYEPWFFPMSENYLTAEKSYQLGLEGVTIGRWLAQKISQECGAKTRYFSFCADLKTYHRIKGAKKEKAICFVYQPDKPRRCASMALRALQIVQHNRPEVKVYLFGSPKMKAINLRAEHLGMITTEECNKLYNKCTVGLCMSATNPSRIPFEMMAAGLPVVELYKENNLYDLPEDGCLLAEPQAEAIAAALIKIIDDDELREKMSQNGEKFMKEYPLERGFEEFKKAVEDGVKSGLINKKLYKARAVKPMRVDEEIGPTVHFVTDVEKADRQRRTVWGRVYLKLRYMLVGR